MYAVYFLLSFLDDVDMTGDGFSERAEGLSEWGVHDFELTPALDVDSCLVKATGVEIFLTSNIRIGKTFLRGKGVPSTLPRIRNALIDVNIIL